MKTPLIGLVMIVRDDATALERCLDSVLASKLVDTWTVCDTGSKDETRRIVRRKLAGLPGKLYRHTWRSFGANRTLALARARGSARWLLTLDADMTVWANPNLRRWLGRLRENKTQGFYVTVEDNGLRYRLPLLVDGRIRLRYVGATHEYLDLPQARCRLLNGLTVRHHGDGSHRADKLERDLALLAPGVEAGDARATFYAAETLRYLGRHDEAIVLYDRRAKMPGMWEEEAWYAAYQAARLRESVPALLAAYARRPWRHEPLTAAARIVSADPRAELDLLFQEASQ